MREKTPARLDAAIRFVCPIYGVGEYPDGGIRIDYKPEATEQQRAAALAVVAGFDFTGEADDAWEESRHVERKTLREQAAAAIDANQTFAALANPNNAQTLAQVKRLTQQNTRIIRCLVELLS